jgi:hypothetical protein
MLLKGMTMDYKEKLAARYYDKNPSEFKKDALSFYGLENPLPLTSSPNHLVTPTHAYVAVSGGGTWVVTKSANTRNCTRHWTIAETTSLEAAQAVIRLMGV